ncbi:MAG: hypothetical protein ACI915_003949 [Gammaproteobacteria bacterium]|jgi:hypothetical protein
MKTTYLAPRLVIGFVLTILQTQTFLLTNAQAAGLSEPQPQSDSENAQSDLRGDIRKLTDKLAADVADVRRRVSKSSNAPYADQDRKTSKQQTYDFELDIKPVLDRKCVACHACYDAPCQLNLGAGTGLERGASKAKVYDGRRLSDIPPTRLGIDGKDAMEWRSHGFFPVLVGDVNSKRAEFASLFQNMINLGRSNSLPPDRPVPADIDLDFGRDQYCPSPQEFPKYVLENPQGGMPLYVSGLNAGEHEILSTWLEEGAKIPLEPVEITSDEQSIIERWEAWFNREEKKSKLLARYLYEHLFLAHLYFDDVAAAERARYFKLIRSSTPTGFPAIVVKSVRPNDDPKGAFYYRLVPITDTIVHKTHITYSFGQDRLARYKKIFMEAGWSVDNLPDYSDVNKANPFITFRAIPALSRYQFLLEDAAFFVRNFIRGPVCRGQIATAVIRDQFWIMFEDPSYERYVNDDAYRRGVDPLLGLPHEKSALLDLGSDWFRYRAQRNGYLEKRQANYRERFRDGAQLEHIWNGSGENSNAFLTVFRHHNSASVMQGWRGGLPFTSWLMDYPLLERTFYELVVDFNVFGSVLHQAQTRLYFDLIRNEGETNFLRLLPPESRKSIYNEWYQFSGQIKIIISYPDLDLKSPSAIRLSERRPQRDLLSKLLTRYPKSTRSLDTINRCTRDCATRPIIDSVDRINRAFGKLAARSAKDVSGIRWLPEVSFLRLNQSDGDYLTYSLLRNRRHSNVAFLLGESLRYQEDLDSLTILPELVGSYPNLIFDVDQSDLQQFTDTLASVESDKDFEGVIERWGIRRMNPQFWNLFHSFTSKMRQKYPFDAGIYDMGRYGHW